MADADRSKTKTATMLRMEMHLKSIALFLLSTSNINETLLIAADSNEIISQNIRVNLWIRSESVENMRDVERTNINIRITKRNNTPNA